MNIRKMKSTQIDFDNLYPNFGSSIQFHRS